MHASNATRFNQSYREIADQVKIPSRSNPQANIFKLVHDWLRNEKNGKWFLVLDNCDDAGVLLEAHTQSPMAHARGLNSHSTQPLFAYLPPSQNGAILVTTRSRSVALKLVEDNDIITVKPMDKVHALALFEKKLGRKSEKKDANKLVAALEFMPLAIVQAASYISRTAPRCSVRQYIEEFQKSEKRKISLLNYEAGHLRRDREAKNSVIVTWQISFDYIRQTRPSAANLLALMSFFDRQGIPEVLIRDKEDKGNNDNGDNNSLLESTVDNNFEDDVSTLRDYSFISVTADPTIFEMHGLVQLATRKWLEAHGKLERWKEQYIRNLYAEFPRGEFEDWPKCRVLFPHAKSALAQPPEGEGTLREWASILCNAARYACARGFYADAERMSIKSMQVRKKLLGEEHEFTIDSMAMLASAYKLGGRWKEAEQLEVQVLEMRKKVLGAEHQNTLNSMANLASTFRDQGRWKESMELDIQVTEAERKLLSAEHPSTLASISNLALTYWSQGRWKEAEELGVQVLETSKRVLGVEHPNTLDSMLNLASTYRSQGQWKKAEELDIQVMEAHRRVLGAEHPYTLTSTSNLALTYHSQGRWKEAEELGMRVLETRKGVLGAEHPDTLTSILNLAATYTSQGRWEEAEELQVNGLEVSTKVLGAEHPSTLASMANLALTYWNQGRLKEAEGLGVKVIEMRKRVLGAEHPETLASLANLAATYGDQGRWNEAEELEVQVLEIYKRSLGAEHPHTLTSMNNLAFTLRVQRRNQEALGLMRKCVQQLEQVLGLDHPDTISSQGTLNEWEIEDLDL